MQKNKIISIILSIILSELTTLTVNAQTWVGNGYYFVRNSNDTKTNDLDEMDFDYQMIMNNITYKDLCCFYLDKGIDTMGDAWFPIAVYISADRAINQIEPLEYEKFYLHIADAKIKDAYQLIEGKPYIINDINMLYESDKDNLSFSLVQFDSSGKETIVGYINGKDAIAMFLPSVKKYEKKK